MPVRLKKLIGTVIIVALVVSTRLWPRRSPHTGWRNRNGMCTCCISCSPACLWVVPAMFVIRWMERPPKNKQA
jgi:hypothetical protein